MICNKIKPNTLSGNAICWTGFGKNEVRSLGCFEMVIEIDCEQFPFTIHVVPSETTNTSFIIGSDVLATAEMIINAKGITVRKTSSIRFLTQINTIEEQALDTGSTDPKIREETEEVVKSYRVDKTEVSMRIIPKDEKPIFQKPRRLPAPEREIVEKQVTEWLNNGVIEESTFEYASSVVIVKKKDDSPRVCIDYRKLNKVIEKDGHPLPLIEDLLDKLENSRVYSTLDLKNGFFHVSIEKESRKYTAFVTHCGQYEFLKVSFGLYNSPRVFQKFINVAFWELIRQNLVLLYVDDLIVPAANE